VGTWGPPSLKKRNCGWRRTNHLPNPEGGERNHHFLSLSDTELISSMIRTKETPLWRRGREAV